MPQIPGQARQNPSALVERAKGMQEQFAALLPEFLRKSSASLFEIALRNMQRPEVMACEPQSILVALLDSAKYGLPCDGVHAALVPRKGKACFDPMYRGLIEAARRGKLVKNVWASTVYEDDEFVIEEGSHPKLVHKPAWKGRRGPENIVLFYACARFADGFVQSEVVTLDEARRTMAASSAGAKGPWGTHFAAMGEKTAVKRLAKFLPLDPRAAELFQRVEAEEDLPEREPEYELRPTPTGLAELAAQELEPSDDGGGWDLPDEAPAASGQVVQGVTVPGSVTWDGVKGLTVNANGKPVHGKTWGAIVHDPSLLGTVEGMVRQVRQMEAEGKPLQPVHCAAALALDQMLALFPAPVAD